jgi:hypothetical protein
MKGAACLLFAIESVELLVYVNGSIGVGGSPVEPVANPQCTSSVRWGK